jgi:iron complex outermembrane receptor protein
MRRLVTGVGLWCWATGVLMARGQEVDHPDRDTVYVMAPVVIVATEAKERQTPVTFSNLTPRQLRERYSVQDVPVILSELPSITTYSENGNGIGYNYLNLRGFDQRRLSVMVNGVPQNDPEDHSVYWIDFPDLLASAGTIQVQRGAGSAFYGPPAIGGSVNLVTNPFQVTPGVTFESFFGIQEYADSTNPRPLATRKLSVMFNSGYVAGRYMFYGRMGKILSDGYRVNSSVDLSSYFLGTMRIDRDMTTRFHFFGGPIEDGLAYYGIPKFLGSDLNLRRSNWSDWNRDSSMMSYTSRVQRILADGETLFVVPRRSQEIENFAQPHVELIHEWHLSARVTLHNTLFYYTGDGSFDYDASWADTSMLRIGYRYGFPTVQNPANTLVQAFVENKQGGWLPRVEIDHGGGSLTLGAELRLHRSTHWGRISYAEDLPANFDAEYHFYEYNGVRKIVSLYGHELLKLTEAVSLMGSLQFTYNSYGIENEKYLGNTFAVPYFFVNPRLGVNYNVSDEVSGYVSLAYTSREPTMRNLYAAEDSWFGATPQFNADTSGGLVRYDFSRPLAQPEHLLDLEIGGRYTQGDAFIAVSGFWMEFRDELVKNGQVDIFGQPVTGNADRTRHYGIEIDGTVRVVGGFTLSGNATLSRNTLVHFTTYDDGGQPEVLDGNPIAGFPDFLSNLRLTYRNESLAASLLFKYVGPFYTDDTRTDSRRNEAYRVWSGEILYRLPQLGVVNLALRGEVRNILNALYFSNGEGDAFFPAAERNYIVGVTLSL